MMNVADVGLGRGAVRPLPVRERARHVARGEEEAAHGGLNVVQRRR